MGKYKWGCKHPLTIKIGKHTVVLLSWRDYRSSLHLESLNKFVDVFIGLSKEWENELMGFHKYESPLLEKYARWYKGGGELKPLVVLPIEDWNVNEIVFDIAKDVIKSGKRLGFGCVGGHGRTGWLAARLIKYFEGCSGDKAVHRIRKRFCSQCVESSTQIIDLGCKRVSKTKTVEEIVAGSVVDYSLGVYDVFK